MLKNSFNYDRACASYIAFCTERKAFARSEKVDLGSLGLNDERSQVNSTTA